MGNVCIDIMGLTIIEGVNSALDTFISQAYGARNY
jgi:Na+-driven multidrug efflux pump